MSMPSITSRGIIGDFYRMVEQDVGNSWVPGVSVLFKSKNQESETYPFLGQSPLMREWVGPRFPKLLTENNSITIRNKDFESTIEIPVSWVLNDQTGQIKLRVSELATKAAAHWASLLTELIVAGESSVCYDGQYFFDTDHVEGSSGTQSNKITVDIISPTKPDPDEMEAAIMRATGQLLGIKDEFGEPVNETARKFIVMVPVSYMKATAAALGCETINGTSNSIQAAATIDGYEYIFVVNARLPWTTKFALFRADSNDGAFIRQDEEDIVMQALAEGSELEFNNDVHRYGIRCSRNVGYGFWQRAVLVTFS